MQNLKGTAQRVGCVGHVFWEYAEVLTVWVQIKYFKEKRVMEYKRDQTYAQINKEDAEMAARSKAQRKEKGGIGGWF
jgi:hypothetical protein